MFGMPLLDAFTKLPKASISFIMPVCLSVCLCLSRSVGLSVCLSVCPSAWNKSASTGRFFMKFYSGDFNYSLSRKYRLR
jgi:hypothetical protein